MLSKFLNKLHYLFFLISLLIFIFTIYRSEVIHEGSIRYYYIQFYIISFLLLILGIIIFFLNENLKKNFFLFFSSIIISLYIVESFLLFTENFDLDFNKNKTYLYDKETGQEFDNRTEYDAFIQEREKNPNLKKKIGPNHYFDKFDIDIYPLSGISNSLTFYCRENGYFSYFNTDKYGFRNPNNVWDEKVINYLLVGDSFTLGACVNTPHDISSRLRHMGEKKSVLNLGYGGNGPLLSYAALREYMPQIKVKNVLFLFYEENELDDLKIELKHPILKKYFENKNFTQNLLSRQNEIDILNSLSIEKALISVKEQKIKRKKLHLSQALKFYRIRTLILSAINKEEVITPKKIPEFKKILKHYKEFTRENNSNFYFVYLPTYHRYNNNFENSIYDETLKILEELNINLIDVKKKFDDHPDPKSLFPFRSYAHYNVKGYKFVSDFIYKELNQ